MSPHVLCISYKHVITNPNLKEPMACCIFWHSLKRQQAGQQLCNRMQQRCTCCHSHTHSHIYKPAQTQREHQKHALNTNWCLHLHVAGSLHSLEYKQDRAISKQASKTLGQECLMWPRWETGKWKQQLCEVWKTPSGHDKKAVNNAFRLDWTAADLNECGPDHSSRF